MDLALLIGILRELDSQRSPRVVMGGEGSLRDVVFLLHSFQHGGVWVRVKRLELGLGVAAEWEDHSSFARSSPESHGLALGQGSVSSCGSLLGAGFCRVLLLRECSFRSSFFGCRRKMCIAPLCIGSRLWLWVWTWFSLKQMISLEMRFCSRPFCLKTRGLVFLWGGGEKIQ